MGDFGLPEGFSAYLLFRNTFFRWEKIKPEGKKIMKKDESKKK